MLVEEGQRKEIDSQQPRGSKGVGSKKKRRRRGRRKNLHSTTNLKLLHLNPRGWVSKRAAILDVIDLVKPDYVNINETQLRAGNKVNINGYTCFSKNRKEKAGGGICSAVVNKLRDHTIRVGEGQDDDEWQELRLSHTKPAVSIFNVYGEQEGRSSREEVYARWG